MQIAELKDVAHSKAKVQTSFSSLNEQNKYTPKLNCRK